MPLSFGVLDLSSTEGSLNEINGERLISGQDAMAWPQLLKKCPSFLNDCMWLESMVSPKNFLRGNIFNPDRPHGSLKNLSIWPEITRKVNQTRWTRKKKKNRFCFLINMVLIETLEKSGCLTICRGHFYSPANSLNFSLLPSAISSFPTLLPRWSKC